MENKNTTSLHKEETVEQRSDEYAGIWANEEYLAAKSGFEAGAAWKESQQGKMFTREEIIGLLQWMRDNDISEDEFGFRKDGKCLSSATLFNEWFDSQFPEKS